MISCCCFFGRRRVAPSDVAPEAVVRPLIQVNEYPGGLIEVRTMPPHSEQAYEEAQLFVNRYMATSPLIQVDEYPDGLVEITTLPPHSEEAAREAKLYMDKYMAAPSV